MMTNLILFLTMYPVLFVLYFCFRGEYQYKNGSLFAVNLEKEWLNEPKVCEVIQNFRKEMRQYVLFLSVVPLATFLVKYMSIQITIWIMWIVAVCFILCLPLVHANWSLKNWKKERHYYEKEKMEHYVELKGAGQIHKVHMIPFFIPTVLGFFCAGLPYLLSVFTQNKIIDVKNMSWICFLLASCGVLIDAVAIYMDRLPTTVISMESDVNLNYTRAKKNIWKNFCLVGLWINTIFVFVVFAASCFLKNSGIAIVAACVVYSLCILGICIPFMKQFKNVDAIYMQKQELSNYEDEDKNWIGGILYYNPKDRHTIVTKKLGMGTTINLATAVGKGCAIFTVLVFLSLPALCVWLMMEEFTPISLSVENGVLSAQHVNVEYEILVDEVENVVVIDKLPVWSKSSGTAMDTLEKGSFFIRNVGKCQVFLNPKNSKFLSFSANGTTYYMSGTNDEQTEEIYRLLTELSKSFPSNAKSIIG